MNKHACLRPSILELSKILMYNVWVLVWLCKTKILWKCKIMVYAYKQFNFYTWEQIIFIMILQKILKLDLEIQIRFYTSTG